MTRMEEYAFTKADKALPATPVKTIRGTFDSTWKDQLLTWNGVSMTYDAIGNMVKKGNTTYTWTQGRKLSAVNNGKKIQYFYDHTGLIDENGTSVVQYQYDSWGKLLGIKGSLASTIGKRNPFRYRGYYYDDETGMYYLQSRYYDPEIKRFICADDIDNVSDLQEMPIEKNLYIYCDNNPIARIDTNGRAWLGVAIAGIAGDLSSVGKQIKDGKSLKELNLIDVASSAISCAVAVTGPGAAYGAKLGRLKIKRKLNKLNYAGKGINYRVHRRIIGWGFYSDGKTGESYTYPIYSS